MKTDVTKNYLLKAEHDLEIPFRILKPVEYFFVETDGRLSLLISLQIQP